MIKPKPCPFCGGKVAVVICDDEGTIGVHIYDTAEDAIEAWNKRL